MKTIVCKDFPVLTVETKDLINPFLESCILIESSIYIYNISIYLCTEFADSQQTLKISSMLKIEAKHFSKFLNFKPYLDSI